MYAHLFATAKKEVSLFAAAQLIDYDSCGRDCWGGCGGIEELVLCSPSSALSCTVSNATFRNIAVGRLINIGQIKMQIANLA